MDMPRIVFVLLLCLADRGLCGLSGSPSRGDAARRAEAKRADEGELGDNRLIEAIQSLRDLSACELVERLIAEVREFTGGAFRDDATLVCVAIG